METAVNASFALHCRRWLAGLLAASGLLAPGQAQSASGLCPDYSYTLGFFNGVWNTPADAAAGATALRETLAQEIHGDAKHEDPDFGVEVFYNASGLRRNGAGSIEDVIEVFEQRTTDLDHVLAKRWELFWETLDGHRRLWDRIGAAIPRAVDLGEALAQAAFAHRVSQTTRLAARPPTELDYAAHALRLRALLAEGQALLLVAHSQGNFFLNQAYRTAIDDNASANVRALHIAPASSFLSGPHTLSAGDKVISALRLTLPGPLPDSNIELPASNGDVTGHMLAETYLDAQRVGRATIAAQMRSLLAALEPPAPRGSPGFFTVTLSWDGPGDIDLHTFEPNGSHVYYDIRTGTSGALDMDNTAGFGPEHYHASCDASRLQTGSYRIGINHYAAANGRTATVQVASARNGVLDTRRLGVGPERGSAGDGVPISVFDVLLTNGAEQGWKVGLR